MSELINKIKSWYSSITTKQLSFERKGIKPKKDWNIILFLTFIALIFAGALSFYIYTKIDNGTLFKVPEKENISEIKINNLLLKKMIDDYDNRAKSLIEIKNGKNIPPNPAG